MTKKTIKNSAPPPQHEREDAWLFDELMTPQPDAAREFFRDQAKKHAPNPTPRPVTVE